MDLKVVLIDESNGAKTSSGESLNPALLTLAAQVFTVYLNRDVSRYWGGQDLVRSGSSPTDVQAGEVPSYTQPTLDNAPGAIAYHTVDGYGIPAIYDGLTLSDTLFGPSGWSVAQTHELAETKADPATNTLRADGKGRLYAQEACDPLEVQSYPITLKADGTVADVPNTTPGLAADGSFTCYVSNFVLDAFFTPGHEGPYDFMTARGIQPAGQQGPAGPFQLVPADGGDYQIVETDPENESQITAAHAKEAAAGDDAEPPVPALLGRGTARSHLGVFGKLNRRVAKKAHPTSRPYRRGLRLTKETP